LRKLQHVGFRFTMTTVYLLPCVCGETLRIDPSQAGLAVRCVCGRDVKAPTFRELNHLERIEEESHGPHAPEWGTKERLLLLGGIVTIVGLFLAGLFWIKTPRAPTFVIERGDLQTEIDSLSTEQVISVWNAIGAEGLDKSELAPIVEHRERSARTRGFMFASLGAAAIGALMLLSALFVGKSGASGAAGRKPH